MNSVVSYLVFKVEDNSPRGSAGCSYMIDVIPSSTKGRRRCFPCHAVSRSLLFFYSPVVFWDSDNVVKCCIHNSVDVTFDSVIAYTRKRKHNFLFTAHTHAVSLWPKLAFLHYDTTKPKWYLLLKKMGISVLTSFFIIAGLIFLFNINEVVVVVVLSSFLMAEVAMVITFCWLFVVCCSRLSKSWMILVRTSSRKVGYCFSNAAW